MKLIIPLFFALCMQKMQGQDMRHQLLSLTFNKFERDEKSNMLFHQFNFKVSYENGQYFITSLKNDSILFKPKQKSFYETFDNEYLLATPIDSRIIPKGSSRIYCMYPRSTVFIVPIDSINNLRFIYKVNLGKRIIMEDLESALPGYVIPTDYEFYKIKEIDIVTKKITIINKMNKENVLYLKKIKR